MGNFWIPHFNSSSSSPCSTRASSPAISKNNSNEGTHSGSKSAFSSSLNEVSPYYQILPITPTSRIFSFAELKMATGNFNLGTLIAGGDFGQLFKGWIDEKTFAATKGGSGMAIAVKIVNFENLQSWKDQELFSIQSNTCLAKFGSGLNRFGFYDSPNKAGLLGYCWEDKELLLVYKYTPGAPPAPSLWKF